MKKTIAMTLLGLSLFVGQASAAGSLELEPCINGGVSASGLHVSQEIEDQINSFADTDLEPTINGGVSASGLFPSQEMEDAAYGEV